MRTLHVLPPAPGDADSASAPADPALRPAAPGAPVRMREPEEAFGDGQAAIEEELWAKAVRAAAAGPR
ncbi:hypothetical protein AB0P37_39430 [Streptomyces antimycoticus]|uniref:hypothetical protein n=1 Tax=Streptomyces antimycoticus TaxID=68175 RepID=UPI00341FB277